MGAITENGDRKLTDEVKEYARRLGAELVGVGPVERWKNAPLMLSPQGLLPSSRTVITFGIFFTDASMELTEKEMSEHWYNPYDMCENMTGMNERLNTIAFNITKFLEGRGYQSLYTPVSNIWRIKPYKSIDHPFAPALAHRYAAVACGLGEIGWSGLFLSPEYGSRQRVIPVVTEAPLEATPMYDGPPLCDKCMQCVKRCPLDCFRKEVRKINKIDIGGKTFEFPDINKWRCYLDYYGVYGPFVPDKITEEVAVRIAHSEAKPIRSIMDSGACLCSCVPPHLRYTDDRYPRGIRRKRVKATVSPRDVTEKLRLMAEQKGIDYLGIAGTGELSAAGIRLDEYLPDGAAALIIGIGHSSAYLKGSAKLRLKDVIFDISHYLQDLGYSTLPIPRIPESTLAGFFGFKQGHASFTHLLTELPLAPLRVSPSSATVERAAISSEIVKTFAAGRGADLVGVSSVERLNRIYPSIKAVYDQEQTLELQREWIPGAPTHRLKNVAIGKVTVKSPEQHLPGAKSVIVLGVHYPTTILARLAKPPAENIASYTGTTQGWGVGPVIRLLALDLVRFLNQAGYRAEVVSDFFGTGYGVNVWGPCEGVTASRFAAVCAGLGEIGWHGAVLTPEYGLTQKFVTIVTDAQLEEDPLYRGDSLCKKCLKCVSDCPVGALSKGDAIRFKIEDKVVEFGTRNRLRCEWAAKCGLVGEEGPKYLGVEKSFPPPNEITADAVSDALRQLNAVEQSWCATFERCLSVCPSTQAVLARQTGAR